MAWYHSLIGRMRGARAKNYSVSGGVELLARLVAPEVTATSNLEQYGKSLYVFACVNKIAKKTAAIPLELYRVMNSKGDTREIDSHPVLDLLYKPNPHETKQEFLEKTIINLKLTGDAFWYKVRNSGGRVVELWNLRPDRMTVVTDPVLFIKGYELAKFDGSKTVFAPEDIVHLKYADPINAYTGQSPLKPAQTRVSTEQFATQFQRDFFLNSARPDAVIKNPNSTLTTEQKEDIREGWNKRHGGPGNTSKIAILEGGLEYQLISITQKDMDFIEGLKMTRDDILVAFSVPKPIVAITDDVNLANAKTAMEIFLRETIKPEIEFLVEKMNELLVYPDFDDTLFLEFEDPTPANRELELKEYSEGLANKYLLINEVRQREGLEPITGGWTVYGSIADVPIGGLSQSKKSIAIAGGETKESAYEKLPTAKRKVYDFRGRSMLKTKFEIKEALVTAAEKSIDKTVEKKTTKKSVAKKPAKKKGTATALIKEFELKKLYAAGMLKKIDGHGDNLKSGMDGFAADQRDRVLKALEANAKGLEKGQKISVSVSDIFDKKQEAGLAVTFITPYLAQFITDAAKEALDLIAPQEDFQNSKHIQAYIKARAKEFGKGTTATTLEKVSRTLSEGISAGEGIADLRDRINSVFDEFPTYRSELIARTEATAANNRGAIEGFRQSGVANGKEWINSGDDRVRDEHEDAPVGVGGEIVELDAAFSNGLNEPSEPNCRCVLGPAFIEK